MTAPYEVLSLLITTDAGEDITIYRSQLSQLRVDIIVDGERPVCEVECTYEYPVNGWVKETFRLHPKYRYAELDHLFAKVGRGWFGSIRREPLYRVKSNRLILAPSDLIAVGKRTTYF